MKDSLQQQGYKYQHKALFTSIDDLPQWNWVQVHKTNNFAYLKKLNSYRKLETDRSKKLEQLWFQIYDEYLAEFERSKEYEELMECKKSIARMKNEYILTEDRNLLTFIKIEELELEHTLKKGKGMSFESVVVSIQKIQGINIPVKEITVYSYNNYLRALNNNTNG